MSTIRFGTDGWRARYGEGFDEESVARLAEAVARMFARADSAGTVYVGYDTRRDGAHYAEVAAGVLAGVGLRAVLSDACCPVPALGWTVAHDPHAVGGVMITASHNPADYNGMKVRMADGGACPQEVTDAIEVAVPPRLGVALAPYETADIMGPYLADLATQVDTSAIAAAHLKVVLDPMGGAAQGSLASVLRDMGVEVAELHGDVDEAPVSLEPRDGSSWTDACRDLVLAAEAHAGFFIDCDGDRVGAVDGRGRIVSSHKIMALVMDILVQAGMTGRVVTTTAGSELVRRQAARLGCPVTETPIGFKWVYGEMLKGGVLLGGEESGGIGVPSHLFERDALYTVLLLCEFMARSGKTLAQLLDDLEGQIGRMEYARRDLRLDAASLQMFLNILPGLNPPRVAGMVPSEVGHTDGLRLRFADGSWLLVRASGTEPLLRIYAEAPTAERREQLLDAGCALAENFTM